MQNETYRFNRFKKQAWKNYSTDLSQSTARSYIIVNAMSCLLEALDNTQ